MKLSRGQKAPVAAPEDSSPELEPAAPAKVAMGFRLKEHECLHHDGMVFKPGSELPFTAAELEALKLMHLVEPL